MSTGNPIVVKIGGRMSEDDRMIACLADEFRLLIDAQKRILLVHGGGVTISRLQKVFGIEPRFEDGLRKTAPDEMPLVDMALAGAVNKHLVRILANRGIRAWGVSGADAGILTAASLSGNPGTDRTGRVTSVDTGPLIHLWNGGFLPVFAPPATDPDGRAMNINADEAALELAAVLNTSHLVFLSDVPGVLEGGSVIGRLDPAAAERKITDGVIGGGMIPKVRSAAGALARGVGAVHIADYNDAGDLNRVLSGLKGTRIGEVQ